MGRHWNKRGKEIVPAYGIEKSRKIKPSSERTYFFRQKKIVGADSWCREHSLEGKRERKTLKGTIFVTTATRSKLKAGGRLDKNSWVGFLME